MSDEEHLPWEEGEPYKLEEWPDENDPKAWVEYALKRLANEIYCALGHVERGEREEDSSDYVNAAMHLASVAEGLQETARALFTEMMEDNERIAVTVMQMERKLGIPVKVVEGPNGTVMIVPDQIVVGENVDDLLNGNGGGDE